MKDDKILSGSKIYKSKNYMISTGKNKVTHKVSEDSYVNNFVRKLISFNAI